MANKKNAETSHKENAEIVEQKMTVSRRRFLQSSLAAGVAVSLPWLPGCGEGDLDGEPRRTNTTLHFDLSAFDPEKNYVINAIGTRANKHRLKRHTAESRATFRAKEKFPRGVSDTQLTHYEEDVDLLADGVHQIWVSAGEGPAAPLVLSAIFCGTIDPGDSQTWLSPRDTAIALIFHHNEIVRLDPDQAATVCAHIDSSPALVGLTAALQGEFGDPFTAVPVTDLDGAPMLNDDGEQLVQWDPSEAVLIQADAVVKDVLSRIFDDPGLENANWHSATGLTSMEIEPTMDLGAAGERFASDYPFRGNHSSSAHGLYFTRLALTDPATRTIQLEVKNFWLRFLTAHVDFLNHSGVAIESQEQAPFQGFFEYNLFNHRNEQGAPIYSRFLSVVGANNDILGIPVLPEHQVPTILRFRMPPGAAVAKVSFLTMGLGGETPNPPNGGGGSRNVGPQLTLGKVVSFGLTSIINIGIPSFLLATAVGSDPLVVKSILDIAKDPVLWAQLLTVVPYKIFDSITREDARPALISVGSKLVSLTLKSLPRLATILLENIPRLALQQAVPIAGWGLKMASLAAATAQLGQTVGEVLSSPQVFQNKISLTLTNRLTVRHDPENTTGFPATATRWLMQANYDGKIAQNSAGRLPTTRTDPLSFEFTVASGGKAKIDIWFLTDTNWIAGHGTTGEFDNLSTDGVISREITIKENLVPITAMTQYHHRQKLAITDGVYHWQAARDTPPTPTVIDLGCDNNRLCDLNGISLAYSAATVGYSWQARSRTLPLCGATPTSSPVQRIQNMSLTERPQDGLKRALCGYTGKPLLAYELRTMEGQPGRYFYLDPTGAGGGYHLRSVSLDRSPFDQTTRLSWGQFTQQQNAIAFHPGGYVVGVNTQFHKLEILRLAAEPVADTEVPASVLKAGQGTRSGLVNTPIAVGVDLLKGAIYVLEAGNQRIQAFDVFGNPVARFRDETSEVLALRPENNVTYADMAVESTGLIYLLSFVGNGASPSDYRLDVYDPNVMTDDYLSRTTGVAAGKMAVDIWRNVYTLNYEAILGPDGLEPSLSQWIPSTPDGCSQATNPFCQRL